ncbi:hypothetical protein CPB84DRAFT_1680027 [Gymnopilus junonius]|uniref:Uncharacterized protein n=1 Tax=Gymnopilus junonius TaxID=109634 RepID=A0A9P5NQ88_GYMJU|nr:hypothetical protein CPB84DRAFT_1680027 [Gymnopilus junonius]
MQTRTYSLDFIFEEHEENICLNKNAPTRPVQSSFLSPSSLLPCSFPSAAMDARPMCRGLGQDGSSCDCEAFLAPQNHNGKSPLHCLECHHGPSKHPAPSQAALTPGSASQNSISVSKENVLSIFEQTVRSGTTKTSGQNSALGSGSVRFTSTKRKAATIPELQSAGCAKVGDIVFSEKWTYEECTSYFQKIFPKPFAYILDAQTAKPPWALITQESRKLKLVTKEQLGGQDLWFYRCGKNRGIEETHIIIGMIWLTSSLHGSR